MVIDFESTCWKDKKPRPEIIEFPAVLLNLSSGKIVSEFHHYVMPTEYPVLSTFCKELTGISQSQVDNGIPLPTCVYLFKQWLGKLREEMGVVLMEPDARYVDGDSLCALVTWSDWDLEVCLDHECRRKHIKKPPWFSQWIDIRAVYKNFYERKPSGLNGALEDLGIVFVGRQHSGIDDAKNTARLCYRMVQDGCRMAITKCIHKQPRSSIRPPTLLKENSNPLAPSSPPKASHPTSSSGSTDCGTNTNSNGNVMEVVGASRDQPSNLQAGPRSSAFAPSVAATESAGETALISKEVKTSSERCDPTAKTGSECCDPTAKAGSECRDPTAKTSSERCDPTAKASSECRDSGKGMSLKGDGGAGTSRLLPSPLQRLQDEEEWRNDSTGSNDLFCEVAGEMDRLERELAKPSHGAHGDERTSCPLGRSSASSSMSPAILLPSPLLPAAKSAPSPMWRVSGCCPGKGKGKGKGTFYGADKEAPLKGEEWRVSSVSGLMALHERRCLPVKPTNGNAGLFSATEFCVQQQTPRACVGVSALRTRGNVISASRDDGNSSESVTVKETPPLEQGAKGKSSFVCTPVEQGARSKSSSVSTPTCDSAHPVLKDGFKTPNISRWLNSKRQASSFSPGDWSSVGSPPFRGKITPPLCGCGRRAKRKFVCSPGPNEGLPFYVCPNGGGSRAKSTRQQGCNYFKWENSAQKRTSESNEPLLSEYGEHR